ncbi:hypothetical protein PFISCL1PPCAC_8598, partial [Pristionchus fissidentatus]
PMSNVASLEDSYDDSDEEDEEDYGSEEGEYEECGSEEECADKEEVSEVGLTAVRTCSRVVDDGWMTPREGEVRRRVVIDGANLVHTGSAYSMRNRDPMLDLSTILAWIRFFLVNDFEVLTVLPQRYLRPTLMLHAEILKYLNQRGLLFVPNSLDAVSDDYIVLDLAAQAEGIVLSVDQYRDHCRSFPEVERAARLQRVSPLFKPALLEDDEWFHLTADGRHWLAYHTIAFEEQAGMGEEEWRGKFFSTPASNLRHDLAVEQRRRWSERRRAGMMEAIDSAIRQRMRHPPAYKDVITKTEVARQLRQKQQSEKEAEREQASLAHALREARLAERTMRRANDPELVD